MRAALWLMGLFAAAVALALFAGDNQGIVIVFWPPYRARFSVNLLLIGLLALFALLYGALRALAAMQALPLQARRWRMQQRERGAHALLLDALTQFQAGRYLRARKSAQAALLREQALSSADDPPPHASALRAIAHLAAAESAHALHDSATRDSHWQAALQTASQGSAAPELREGLLLRAARWALHERDPAAALARLQELPGGASRRTAALRIRLRAAQMQGRPQQALDTARLLAKHGAFSPGAAASLVRQLAADLIAQTRDLAQLQTAWAALDTSERAMPELALRAAQRLLELGGSHAQARQWLLPAWDKLLAADNPPASALAAALHDSTRLRLARTLDTALTASDGTPADPAWLARIETASQARPQDPVLRYLAGIACLHHGLWGKASQQLSQAAGTLPDPVLRRRAWCALAHMAENRGDTPAAAQAWRQAALTGMD